MITSILWKIQIIFLNNFLSHLQFCCFFSLEILFLLFNKSWTFTYLPKRIIFIAFQKGERNFFFNEPFEYLQENNLIYCKEKIYEIEVMFD